MEDLTRRFQPGFQHQSFHDYGSPDGEGCYHMLRNPRAASSQWSSLLTLPINYQS